MARYIDIDKMLKEYQETICFNVLCSLCPFLDNIKDDTCQVEKWINEQPTADVAPVVHGEWIPIDVGDCCYRCSVCNFVRDAYLLEEDNYCPHCGAKMRGDQHEV